MSDGQDLVKESNDLTRFSNPSAGYCRVKGCVYKDAPGNHTFSLAQPSFQG